MAIKITKPIKLRIDIDDDMKFSLNRIWAGWPWTQWIRKAKRDLWHEIISEKVDDDGIKKIPYKIMVDYIFYFKTRSLDCSNCSLMVKMVEDWLVESWILEDDTNKYIGKFSVEVPEIDTNVKKGMETDYVDIIINPYISYGKTTD